LTKNKLYHINQYV